MRYLSLLFITLCLLPALSAQDNIINRLERSEPGQGQVRIHQDPAIANLIGKQLEYDTAGRHGTFKTTGYRVRVYLGNNSRESSEEAQRLGAKVSALFPEIKVYTTFISPRWICKVGDFRSIEEANAVMRELKRTGMFKELTILRGEQITITL